MQIGIIFASAPLLLPPDNTNFSLIHKALPAKITTPVMPMMMEKSMLPVPGSM